MQSFRKSIEFFTEERYRDLDYGTVYYVAGTETPDANEYMMRHLDFICSQINKNKQNWLTCKIICLTAENDLFPQKKKPTLYSAVLPCEGTTDGISAFLAASLDIKLPDLVETVVSKYFTTLQQMLDEILDTGHYQEHHLKQTILSPYDDDKIHFSISRGHDDDIQFSIRVVPLPYTEPSRLTITPNTYQVLLPDYKREIRLTAQVKALYILFLNHPEGIRMKEITDYKVEYEHIYLCVTNRSDKEKLKESIDKLLDVCNRNALDVKKSQCNAAIYEAIPNDDLRAYYEIEVNRGLPHKIKLDRSLVYMPDNLRRHSA